MSNIIDSIRMSGTTYAISDSGGTKVVEITQSDYDNLPTSAKTANIMYVITDAEPFDVSNYYTKAETSGATELATAFAATQPKLSAGTNITIDANNVISAEGGGGKAVVGGRGITVTTGATADTVSFSLPISAGTGSNSVIEGDYANKATGSYSHAEGGTTSATTNYAHAEGMKTKAAGQSSHAEGERTTATTHYSHTEGYFTIANNKSEHASGQYNVSNKTDTTFGHSGNTLFSVGNGTDTTARHNAFEIRQNGDIYLTKDGQDIKLQDQLGGGGGIDSGTVQTMIDQSISGKTNQTDFVSHSGNTSIHVTTAQTAAWDAKSDFSGSYNDLSNKPTIPTSASQLTNDSGYITSSALNGYATEAWVGQQGYLTQHQDISGKLDVSAFNTYSGSVDTTINSKASQASVDALNGVVTAHTADTTIHVTAQDKTNWNNKSDFSGSYNDLTDKPTIPTVPTNVSDFVNDVGYVTSTAVTQSINEAVSGKADSADIVDITGFGTQNSDTLIMTREKNGSMIAPLTVVKAGSGLSISVDAWANKAFDVDTTVIQEKLVSGTNIKTINNESILGSGNITIEGGGGKAIVGGRGITVTSGETANTVSFNLPISAGTNSSNLIIVGERCVSNGSRSIATGFYTKAQQSDAFAQGYKTDAGQEQSHAEGYETKAYGVYSHSEGRGTSAMTAGSHAEGIKTITSNSYEHSQGWYNVSNKTSNTFGDSGNTLFSVGNGTADNARHNAFEIRQNGDIYLNDGSKLQDTVSATTANTTALGGLKLVKLSQSEYDSLATKDNSTLYVIVN